MALKVGINGFGRIGRMVLRSIIENNIKDLDVVAINNRSKRHSSNSTKSIYSNFYRHIYLPNIFFAIITTLLLVKLKFS